MSFLMRSLSRERARTGDLREGRNEVLRELVVSGPAGAAINWLAVSQLLNMVAQKGSVPEVVRKILKDLLSSDDLRTALQALTIVDMLALNCPEGRVRSQLAGTKWVKRLGAKAAAGLKLACPEGLPAALVQLLSNWALVFKGQELGGAAQQECRRLAAQGILLPGPSDEAFAYGLDEAADSPTGTFVYGCDFARDFIPPQALQMQGPVREGSGETGGARVEESSVASPPPPPGGSSPPQPNKRHTVGPPNVRAAVLAQGSLSPAFQSKRANTMPNMQRAIASLTRRSAEPVTKNQPVVTSPSEAVEEGNESKGVEDERMRDGGQCEAGAPRVADTDAAQRLATAVADTIAGIKHDKTALAAADDACRAAVVRFNAGHKDAADTVTVRAEAGFIAARECAKWADRVQALAAQNLPDELLSKMLEANDLLTGQLRRWHAVLSNPVVQAALAGPSSPTSGTEAGRSPPRSMHLLDLPGVWSAPSKSNTRRATAPNTPCSDLSAPPASEATESDRLPSSSRRPASSGRNPPSRTPSVSSFNFVRHTRSVSSPDNCSILDASSSPDKMKGRHAMPERHPEEAHTPELASSMTATGAWEMTSFDGRKRNPTTSDLQGVKMCRRVSYGAQSEGGKRRGVTSAPCTVQDLTVFLQQQQQQQQQQQAGEGSGLTRASGNLRMGMQRTQSGYSEGHTPTSAQQSANSAGRSTPFSEYWHSGVPSPGLSSRASSGALAMSRRVTWDHAPADTHSTASVHFQATGEHPKRADRELSATPESAHSSRVTAAEVAYLKGQVDQLMEQLKEALQAKTQAQHELLESHRARMAAELQVIELRSALEEERHAAMSEAQSAPQAKQFQPQVNPINSNNLIQQTAAECEHSQQVVELEQANVGLQAELSRALELLRVKDAGDTKAGGACSAKDASCQSGPPAAEAGETPHPQSSQPLPTAAVSFQMSVPDSAARVSGSAAYEQHGGGEGSPDKAVEASSSDVEGRPESIDAAGGSSTPPASLDVGQRHRDQHEETQPPTPSLHFPVSLSPYEATVATTDADGSSDDETGLKAVLAYHIEPQLVPTSGVGYAVSPHATEPTSSPRPDLLTLSPDNPFC